MAKIKLTKTAVEAAQPQAKDVELRDTIVPGFPPGRHQSVPPRPDVPVGQGYPGITPAVQQCLDSNRPDAVVRAQSASAAREGIEVTPALRLQDRRSGRTLLLAVRPGRGGRAAVCD